MNQARRRSLSLGLYVFPLEAEPDPSTRGWTGAGTLGWGQVLALAQRAEEVGFDSF